MAGSSAPGRALDSRPNAAASCEQPSGEVDVVPLNADELDLSKSGVRRGSVIASQGNFTDQRGDQFASSCRTRSRLSGSSRRRCRRAWASSRPALERTRGVAGRSRYKRATRARAARAPPPQSGAQPHARSEPQQPLSGQPAARFRPMTEYRRSGSATVLGLERIS